MKIGTSTFTKGWLIIWNIITSVHVALYVLEQKQNKDQSLSVYHFQQEIVGVLTSRGKRTVETVHTQHVTTSKPNCSDAISNNKSLFHTYITTDRKNKAFFFFWGTRKNKTFFKKTTLKSRNSQHLLSSLSYHQPSWKRASNIAW